MHAFQEDAFQALTRKPFRADPQGKAETDAMERNNPAMTDPLKSRHNQTPDRWREVVMRATNMWLGYPDLTAEKLTTSGNPASWWPATMTRRSRWAIRWTSKNGRFHDHAAEPTGKPGGHLTHPAAGDDGTAHQHRLHRVPGTSHLPCR